MKIYVIGVREYEREGRKYAYVTYLVPKADGSYEVVNSNLEAGKVVSIGTYEANFGIRVFKGRTEAYIEDVSYVGSFVIAER